MSVVIYVVSAFGFGFCVDQPQASSLDAGGTVDLVTLLNQV